MVQTPQQRKANEKFAKRQEKSMGKPEGVIKKKDKTKASISPMFLGLLIFVVCGGLIFELLRLVYGRFYG